MTERSFRLGLPLGGLRERSYELAARLIGAEARRGDLYFAARRALLEVFMLKHRDIPSLVADGYLHAGLTSTDWVAEREPELQRLSDTDWCSTRLSVLQAPGAVAPPRSCVTEFPRLARAHLGDGVTVRAVAGSTEGLVPALFDCAVECVQTGATARRHGLTETSVILNAEVALVCRPGVDPEGAGLVRVREALL